MVFIINIKAFSALLSLFYKVNCFILNGKCRYFYGIYWNIRRRMAPSNNTHRYWLYSFIRLYPSDCYLDYWSCKWCDKSLAQKQQNYGVCISAFCDYHYHTTINVYRMAYHESNRAKL